MTQKLPQIYTENHATFRIQIRKITVQICGNFWAPQYVAAVILILDFSVERTYLEGLAASMPELPGKEGDKVRYWFLTLIVIGGGGKLP